MRIVAAGPTDDIFTKDNLEKTYGGRLSLLNDAAHALADAVR
jgi:manganese/zinc/iron transport system ATP- binding protein